MSEGTTIGWRGIEEKRQNEANNYCNEKKKKVQSKEPPNNAEIPK